MEELQIKELLDKVRRKYEYAFSGYFKYVDRDEAYSEVLFRLLDKYNEGRIDISNVENYMFITYRNYLYGCWRDSQRYNPNITPDMLPEDTYDTQYEFYEDPMLSKIKDILQFDYDEMLKYHSRGYHKPKEWQKGEYSEKDIRRFTRLTAMVRKKLGLR